jgi:hypothetical protein
MRVRVLSRVEVEAGGAEGADAVISIRASAESVEPDLAIALAQATEGESARFLRLSGSSSFAVQAEGWGAPSAMGLAIQPA